MKGSRPTRFEGLGYTGAGDHWYFLDLTDPGARSERKIGHSYKTKTELLADVERFAAERCFDGATHSAAGTIAELRKLAVRTNLDDGGDLTADGFLKEARLLLGRHGGAV